MRGLRDTASAPDLRNLGKNSGGEEEEEEEEEEGEEEEEQPMAPPPLPPLRLSLHSPRTSPSPTGSAESEDGEGMTVFIVRSPLAPVRITRNHSLALCALWAYC